MEFFVGFFFGRSHFVYFDSIHKKKIVRYANLEGEMFIDLKHPESKKNEDIKEFINERILSERVWLDFMYEIEKLEILC